MRITILIAVLALANGLGGCGLLGKGAKQAGTAPENQSAATGKSAEFLNLKIVGAGTDPHLPDPGVNIHAERNPDEVIVSGDEIEFRENIFLGKPLFFVWEENALGSAIKNAFVDHRVEDEKNKLVGSVERRTAYFDSATRHWYVPFSELFGEDQYGADPARTHRLRLDLDLADGSRLLIYVRFRAIGAPRIKVTSHASDYKITGDLLAEAQVFAKGERALKTTEITNPLKRDLKIWVRSTSASPLSLKTVLGQETYAQSGMYAPWSGNAIAWLTATTQVAVGSVQVFRGSVQGPKLSIRGGNWVSIDLGSLETIRLDWMATSFSEGSALCNLPPSGDHVMKRLRVKKIPACQGDYMDFSCVEGEDVTHMPEPWHIGGVSLHGSWQVEIQSSNPWELSPSGEVTVVKEELAEGLGVNPAHAPSAFSCQGLF